MSAYIPRGLRYPPISEGKPIKKPGSILVEKTDPRRNAFPIEKYAEDGDCLGDEQLIDQAKIHGFFEAQ